MWRACETEWKISWEYSEYFTNNFTDTNIHEVVNEFDKQVNK